MAVDDLDMANYVNFTGLRRPEPVSVYNPMMLTEIGPEDLSVNKKFRFNY